MRAPFLCALAFLLAASLNLFPQTITGTNTGTTTTSVCHGTGDCSPFTGMTSAGIDGSIINISANNADQTPREVSIIPIQPAGSSMQVFVELQPWFFVKASAPSFPIPCTTTSVDLSCTSANANTYVEFDNHVEVGYNSFDAATVQRQLNDTLKRNFNGVVIDWYGPFADSTESGSTAGNMEDRTVGTIKTAFGANSFCNSATPQLCLRYALVEDQGAWKRSGPNGTFPGCLSNSNGVTQPDQTSCIESHLGNDLGYANTNYLNSTGYLRVSTHPLIQFFVDDSTQSTWSSNWSAVWQLEYTNAKNNFNASLVFKDPSGFSHFGFTDGSFAWPNFAGADDRDNLNNIGTYLPAFYRAGASAVSANPNVQIWGVAYKGFDERTDQARPGATRYIKQNCGRAWFDTIQAIRNPATLVGGPAGLTVPFGVIATWNDYGEGTSIEPGIDNCVSAVNGSDGGCNASHQCTLNWNTVFSDTTGNTEQQHAIANYRIDEVNMLNGNQNFGIATITPDANGNFAHSFTYPDTQFGCDEWFYVNAVGLNSVTNHKSNSVDVHCSSGTAQINGAVQSYYTSDWECAMWNNTGDCVDWENFGYYTYDAGTVTVSAMGISKTVSYDSSSSAQSIATAVANAFNADPNAQVTATVSGAVVSFRSKHLGPTYNQPLGSSWTWNSADPNFTSPSFTVTTSGLQGGVG
jgi:hypothetical protein